MKNWMLMALALAGFAAAGCSTGTTGRGAEIVSCSPGMDITVACGASSLGTCSGDPILTVCDAALMPSAIDCVDSSSTGYLGRNDDSMGLCPSVTVTCPTGGSIAVRPSAFSGVPSCNWETRVAGP